jgi:hypothetical protein
MPASIPPVEPWDTSIDMVEFLKVDSNQYKATKRKYEINVQNQHAMYYGF